MIEIKTTFANFSSAFQGLKNNQLEKPHPHVSHLCLAPPTHVLFLSNGCTAVLDRDREGAWDSCRDLSRYVPLEVLQAVVADKEQCVHVERVAEYVTDYQTRPSRRV